MSVDTFPRTGKDGWMVGQVEGSPLLASIIHTWDRRRRHPEDGVWDGREHEIESESREITPRGTDKEAEQC